MNNKKVFVVGGAGFLGYYTCLELVSRGYIVTCLALPDEPVDDDLSQKVIVARANIDELNDEGLKNLLSGHQVVIYSAGPDDRIELPAGVSATDFFQTQLVNRTERVMRIAKESGVRKAIIFGSYFSYVNNHGIAGVKIGQLERHPYIKARVDQSAKSFALGDENFRVATLNIPYVFGVAPGKTPIWKSVFVDKFGKYPKIYYGNGGTTLISAKKIAFSAVQAIEHAEHGDELAVGSKDMKFTPLIEQLLREAQIDKPVGKLPNWLMSLTMKSQWKKMRKANLDSGLDLRYLNTDILSRDSFVDYKSTDEKLSMSDYDDDIDEAIAETGKRMQ